MEAVETAQGLLSGISLIVYKNRKTPLCPLEEGHRSTSFAHLANIALKVRSRLEWDPARELFTNNEAANQLLHYEYRKPWKL